MHGPTSQTHPPRHLTLSNPLVPSQAFNLIDTNHDGFITKEDLQEMFGSLGKEVDDSYIEGMLNEAPGSINFTMFLTLFGEKMSGTDPEDVIRNAFACFDPDSTGTIDEDKYDRGGERNPPHTHTQIILPLPEDCASC